MTTMNPPEIKAIESQRQALLGQLATAETALRNGLHSQGVAGNVRAHLERAMAHLAEAYVAINENTAMRTVHQLVDDLSRVERVIEDARRQKSQRI